MDHIYIFVAAERNLMYMPIIPGLCSFEWKWHEIQDLSFLCLWLSFVLSVALPSTSLSFFITFLFVWVRISLPSCAYKVLRKKRRLAGQLKTKFTQNVCKQFRESKYCSYLDGSWSKRSWLVKLSRATAFRAQSEFLQLQCMHTWLR